MALTFREQIEATAWELGNGEGTTPELRKRFDADSETPNFDPTKARNLVVPVVPSCSELFPEQLE